MANWKDYENNSQLVLVFGHVSATVDVLGHDAAGKENHWGIITHPYWTMELKSADDITFTREDAKSAAVSFLSTLLGTATNALPR